MFLVILWQPILHQNAETVEKSGENKYLHSSTYCRKEELGKTEKTVPQDFKEFVYSLKVIVHE